MMKMPQPKHDRGTLVYLRANVDLAGIVVGYIVRSPTDLGYLVTWGHDAEEKIHQEFELLTEKPYGGIGES